MEEAWKELMQAYSQILEKQPGFIRNVPQDQADRVFSALNKLSKFSNQDIDLVAQTERGLSASKTEQAPGLYSKLKRMIPDDDHYNEMDRLLAQTFTLVKNNSVQEEVPVRQIQHVQPPENILEAPQKQKSLFGRVVDSAVNVTVRGVARLVFGGPTKPEEENPQVFPVVELKKIPATQEQIEDAWKRLMQTYQRLASVSDPQLIKNQSMEVRAQIELHHRPVIDEKKRELLVAALSNFQNKVEDLNPEDLPKKISALVKIQSLPEGKYMDIFGELSRSLRGVQDEVNLKALFVATFGPAAVEWQKQDTREKQAAGLEEAWKQLMSIYKVVAENVHNAGNIKLLNDELSHFQKVANNFDPQELAEKVTELMKTSGSPTGKSPKENEILLVKLKNVVDEDFHDLLNLTLQTPPTKPSTEPDNVSADPNRVQVSRHKPPTE